LALFRQAAPAFNFNRAMPRPLSETIDARRKTFSILAKPPILRRSISSDANGAEKLIGVSMESLRAL
jgi:hypothetical protein